MSTPSTPARTGRDLERLRGATSGMIVDALRMVGLDGAVGGIRPARGFEDQRLVAPITTVTYGPVTGERPRLSMYQLIRQSPSGSVLVVDGGALARHFVGDNMAHIAKRQGLVGVVVVGGARDVAGFRALGMPLYCMGPAVEPFPAEFGPIAHQSRLNLDGVTADPGDILVADEDGVVVIPAHSLEAVLASLSIVSGVEDELERLIEEDAAVDLIGRALARKKQPQLPSAPIRSRLDEAD